MTHQELILPFRILRHDELPEEHQKYMRARGIDPADQWSLIWSFETREAAEEQLARDLENAASWETYKIVEGEREVIECESWI